jgi:hypothetical protein
MHDGVNERFQRCSLGISEPVGLQRRVKGSSSPAAAPAASRSWVMEQPGRGLGEGVQHVLRRVAGVVVGQKPIHRRPVQVVTERPDDV